METFVMGATLVGSFATAFVLQKAALEALFRAMDPNRRARRGKPQLAGAALRIFQVGLAPFCLRPLGLGDIERSAS